MEKMSLTMLEEIPNISIGELLSKLNKINTHI